MTCIYKTFFYVGIEMNVRKLILMMILTTLSSGAMAEWTVLKPGSTFYVDRSTIQRHGKLVRMSDLADMNASLSFKSDSEYDCQQERSRVLVLTEYSGNMGTGHIVNAKTLNDEWHTIVNATIGEDIFNIACGILKP